MVVTIARKQSIHESVRQFFQEEGLKAQEVDHYVLRLDIGGTKANWTCFTLADEEQRRFSFYSVMQVTVPQEKRLAVAEYLTRASWNVVLGNFEMDFASGEVRYKVTTDLKGSHLTKPMLTSMVYTNLAMMDKYVPGIMNVIYGGSTPEEALGQIDK